MSAADPITIDDSGTESAPEPSPLSSISKPSKPTSKASPRPSSPSKSKNTSQKSQKSRENKENDAKSSKERRKLTKKKSSASDNDKKTKTKNDKSKKKADKKEKSGKKKATKKKNDSKKSRSKSKGSQNDGKVKKKRRRDAEGAVSRRKKKVARLFPDAGPVFAMTQIRQFLKTDKHLDGVSLQRDAVLQISESATLFLEKMLHDSLKKARSASHKTIEYDDIAEAVFNDKRSAFLWDIVPRRTSKNLEDERAALKSSKATASNLKLEVETSAQDDAEASGAAEDMVDEKTSGDSPSEAKSTPFAESTAADDAVAPIGDDNSMKDD